VRFGRRFCTSSLWIANERNHVQSRDLLIDIEKVWIEEKMAIINEGWDGLKRNEERCVGLDWSRID
jgi:hypothetical protein